jgi:hypothetical protein
VNIYYTVPPPPVSEEVNFIYTFIAKTLGRSGRDIWGGKIKLLEDAGIEWKFKGKDVKEIFDKIREYNDVSSDETILQCSFRLSSTLTLS